MGSTLSHKNVHRSLAQFFGLCIGAIQNHVNITCIQMGYTNVFNYQECQVSIENSDLALCVISSISIIMLKECQRNLIVFLFANFTKIKLFLV